MSLFDVTIPDVCIVDRLEALLAHARDIADLIAARDHLQAGGAWIQQVVLGSIQALEATTRAAQDNGEEVISRARMLGHYIWTATGRRFYPQDPRAAEVHLSDIAYALANTNRWNGHTDPPISVAWHSIHVAALARSLAEHDGVDPDEACLYGLLHDAHEAYVGDMVRPILEYMGSEFDAMRTAVQAVIFEALEVPPPSPVIDALVHAADDYALRLEAESLFPAGCDPAEACIGQEPPGWLRTTAPPYCAITKPSAGLWMADVRGVIARLRKTKPEDLTLDSWRDQLVRVEDDPNMEICMVCANEGSYRAAVMNGLCQDCLSGLGA